MKYITKKQYEAQTEKNKKKLRARNPLIDAILNMDVQSALLLSRDEWQLSSLPVEVLANYKKRYGRQYKTKTLADGSGWAVLRTK